MKYRINKYFKGSTINDVVAVDLRGCGNVARRHRATFTNQAQINVIAVAYLLTYLLAANYIFPHYMHIVFACVCVCMLHGLARASGLQM